MTAYATNKLDLVDSSSMTFTVAPVSGAPWIGWGARGVMRPDVFPSMYYGSFWGSNTPQTAPWFHTSAVSLKLHSEGAPLNSFTITRDGAPVYAKAFIPGTTTVSLVDALDGDAFSDAAGYYAVLADSLGGGTSAYFNLDKTGPKISLTATSYVSGNSFDFQVSGNIDAAGAGIGGELEILDGNPMSYGDYTGPAYPVGQQSRDFGPYPVTSQKTLRVFDRAGGIGVYQLDPSYRTNIISIGSQPGGGTMKSYPVWSESGIMLRNLEWNAGVWPPIDTPPIPCDTPAEFIQCGKPVGMKAELWARSADYPEDYVPGVPLKYGFEPVYSKLLFSVFDNTDITNETLNLPMGRVMHLEMITSPNTNTVSCSYTCHTPADHIVTISYPPGSYDLQGSASAGVAYTDLWGGQFYTDYIQSGDPRVIIVGNVSVTIHNVTKGGNISVETARRTLSQPGYKMAEGSLVYEIKTTAIADGPIELQIAGLCAPNYSQQQRTAPVIMHCTDGGGVCEKLTAAADGCVARVTVDSLSPFALMVPIDDITAPHTALAVIGEQAGQNGVLWINTDAYLDLEPDDAATMGDITGVATTYVLINVEPTSDCLAAPQDPAAPFGSCANSVYDGAFSLAEGSYTLTYLSADNWGNVEEARIKHVSVDGTRPETAIMAKGAEVQAGAAAYITQLDTITLTAVDPVSNGVASGVKVTNYYIDAAPDSCEEEPSYTGPAGTCANPGNTDLFFLSVGTHTVYYYATDNVGNRETARSATFYVSYTEEGLAPDSTPPVTALSFSTPTYNKQGWLMLSGASRLSMNASDAEMLWQLKSGVAGTYYALDPVTETPPELPYTAPFGSCRTTVSDLLKKALLYKVIV